ncbi:MAG: hypothetical protein R3338_04375 [Thermoanaerobaculia bacterium]|nr:hypothetical protein [Thermoanaerobaculia bacterium]
MLLSMPAFGGTVCEMSFELSGWSLFYKTASGEGTIECDNGQTADVLLKSKGGGITFGKSRIEDGIGKFTEVDDISDLYGTYVQAEAHAGAAKSAKASAMTKGEVSLSLAGKGEGVDLGVAFGKFVIERAD